MGDMQVGVVANIDDKAVNRTLQVSVSLGRFENDSLSWEKLAFSPNKYFEEVGSLQLQVP